MAVKKSFVEKMTAARVCAREDVFKHIAQLPLRRACWYRVRSGSIPLGTLNDGR